VSLTYDLLGRMTGEATRQVNHGALLYGDWPTYDAVGNVVAVSTTLPQGVDNQAFCYDAQNRLTWAGSTGTPPCGEPLAAGTLSSANYTASYSYDTLDRLTSGPLAV
jgi:hypothetical protein